MPYYPLLLHCLTIAFILIVLIVVLARHGLFAPDRTGFWFWIALFISLLLNPSVTLLAQDYKVYEHYTSGTTVNDTRIYWVLLLSVLGIASFYLSYLTSKPLHVEPREAPFSHEAFWIVMAFFLAVGFNAIIRYRMSGESQQLVNGKFTGNVSGWQSDTHCFVIYPCLIFLAIRRYWLVGVLVGLGYILARMNDKSDRFSIVVLPMAAFLFHMVRQGRRWPSLLHCVIAASLLLFLVARGHKSADSMNRAEVDPAKMVSTALINLGTGPDTSMLPTFYRESDLIERHGFTYGTTLLQEIFFAPLPRPLFPWKDEVFSFIPGVEWKNTGWYRDVYAAKSTIICAFYGYGGALAVIVGMACLGILLRKMDGFINKETPVISLAWAVMLLASIWLAALGTVEWWYKMAMMWSLPALGLVFANRLLASFTRRQC